MFPHIIKVNGKYVVRRWWIVFFDHWDVDDNYWWLGFPSQWSYFDTDEEAKKAWKERRPRFVGFL